MTAPQMNGYIARVLITACHRENGSRQRRFETSPGIHKPGPAASSIAVKEGGDAFFGSRRKQRRQQGLRFVGRLWLFDRLLEKPLVGAGQPGKRGHARVIE